MTRRTGMLVALVLVVGPVHAAPPTDADRDGLGDDLEARLGTDPNCAEAFVTIQRHPVRPSGTSRPARAEDGPARLDVRAVGFAPVARGRYVWRLDFAAPFQPDNAQVIVYLNSDNDKQTGRKDVGGGVDVMLVHRGKRCQVRLIDATGASSYAPLASAAIANGALYLCADLPIAQVDGRSVFDIRVLCETVKPHRGVDGTPWSHVVAAGEVKRDPPPCLERNAKTAGLLIVAGLERIEKVKADPNNVVIPMADWTLDGFVQDVRSEYRASSVVRRGMIGRLTAPVPKAGRWHVGFVLYDDGGDDRVAVCAAGKHLAFLAGDWDDRRQYLYVTERRVDLRQGDPVTLEAVGAAGRYRIETVMLLATRPPASERRLEIERLAATIPTDTDVGSAEVTWTTTWCARGRVEYGASRSFGQTVEEQGEWNNHRVWLRDLKPGSTVHYRVVCARPDGGEVATEAKSFVAKPPPVPPGQARRERLPLTLTGVASVPAGWPITGGVPLPRGALGSARNVRLLDAEGHEQPLQVQITSRWDDGSIRWLLLDFQTTKEWHRGYVLEYGCDVGPQAPPKPGLGVTCDDRGVHVDTGVMRVDLPRDRFAPFVGAVCRGRELPGLTGSVADGSASAGAFLVDAEGRTFGTLDPPDSVEVELRGPRRAVVRIRGRFTREDASLFRYDARLHFYALQPFARLSFTFSNDNTSALFTDIERLSLRLPIPGQEQCVAALDDKPPRPAGRVACASSGGVAVREFWQHWPKTLSVDQRGVEIGICPKFDPARVPPDGTDRHRLYYYLQTGRYKLKQGVSKRHEILVSLGHGDGAGDFATQAAAFERPLLLTAPAAWYAETKVFGDIAGPEPVFLSEYDQVFAKAFDAYLAGRERNREYGMLNFGDWWGERGINWGNIEYDTQHAFLLQWARTGKARYFRTGVQAANHHMDVDLIHHSASPDRRGRVYAHCIGHTGDYYRRSPVEGKGSTGGYLTVSHTWVEGFLDDYFLTGDRRALEAARMIADRYDAYGTQNYDFTNCRIPGWHLILSMAMYRATRDPFHLNACHLIMERVLERQTPDGGWRRQMVPGHCRHLPRHHGNAGFMISVLMTGMRWYHQETGDPRVLDAMHGAARFVVDDMWVESAKGFRYTSCRGTSAGVWGNFMACDGLGYVARLRRDAALARIARVGIKASMASGIPGMGKSISQATRVMPHVLYHLDELERVVPRRGE